MEGWLAPEDNPFSLDILHILHKLQSVGFCSDLEPINDASRFELILSAFLKEFHCKRDIPPFPAMLGDGRRMDLYKLYSRVSGSGGYDYVTANKSWPAIAEGIGLCSSLGCSLKLIYAKYLGMFERCLHRVPAYRSGVGGSSGSDENLGVLMSDSEPEVRSLFREILKQKTKDGADLDMSPCSKKEQFLTLSSQNVSKLLLGKAKCSSAMNPKLANGSVSLLKRKRDSMVEMLDWVKNVAKNPIDPSTGNIIPTESLNDFKNGIGAQYSHAFQARKALFHKRIRTEDIDTSSLQSGQKMLGLNYEDLNCTSNLQSLQPCLHSPATPSPDKPSFSVSSTVCMAEKDENQIENANEAGHCRRTPRNSLLLPEYLTEFLPQRIPVGSTFQAEVPSWTGEPLAPCDSDDLKWLGTRAWPPQHHGKSPEKPDPIGKGRGGGCNCRASCSAECVRFHVAESRLRLKRELGAAFYTWRFHFMGEEVALRWKEEEEQRFKSAFRQNRPPDGKNLWKQLLSCFPRKGNRGLVSYYFNVFLIARRSYQNRVSPDSIDSDDEETESGFLSSTSSYGAGRLHDPRSIICAQNSQCVDLGD